MRSFFNRYTGGHLTRLAAPAISMGAGLGAASYLSSNLYTKHRPAYAWWGNSTQTTTTTPPQQVSNFPQTAAKIEHAAVQSLFTKPAVTSLDQVLIKENIHNILANSNVTEEEIRGRLSKYTEQELKSSLSDGTAHMWVMKAFEDIKKNHLLNQQHEKGSEAAYKAFRNAMINYDIIPIHKGVVQEIHLAQYQANTRYEDNYSIHTALHSTPGTVIGVYDGHSGLESSRYCSENLVPYLDFFKYYHLSQEFMDPNVIEIADNHYIDLALGENAYKALTGACLLLTQITNMDVSTLWSGDCRAFVIRDDAEPYTGPLPKQHAIDSGITNPPVITHTLPVEGTLATTTGDFADLTIPHQIDLNYYEKQRLLNTHPNEPDIIARSRVKGGLQPTRAFGDAHYKKLSFFRLRYPNRDPNSWYPPYITARPDHSHYKLDKNDQYLVLTSDGLTDAMTPYEIASYLHIDPATAHTDNLAVFLITQALINTGKQVLDPNVSIDTLSQFFPGLAPGKERRRIHDDMTVLVIKLDKSKIGVQDGSDAPTPKTARPRVPDNLREAIKRGLLSDAMGVSANGEFLNTGIIIEPNFSQHQRVTQATAPEFDSRGH